MLYLFLFLSLFLLELAYFRLADHFNIIDKPNLRSSHSRITLRGGGVIFYFGALAAGLMQGEWMLQNSFFFAGLTLLAGISFWDDVRPIKQVPRLVVHFTAMALLFYQWGLLQMPWWYLVVALIVCTGIINAYNFMDGINGITGGYSLVVILALFYINRFRVPFVEEPFIVVLLLAVLVFCFFNFRRKARCFAGDVGAVSMAFILLFLIGKLILQTGDLSYIILLLVYGVDSILTIIHRLLLHESIGEAHRKHAYQLLANELKIPHVAVSGLYMGLQGVILTGYFWSASPYWYLGGGIVLLSLLYVGFMKRYFHLHQL